jgi:hypothetical protein
MPVGSNLDGVGYFQPASLLVASLAGLRPFDRNGGSSPPLQPRHGRLPAKPPHCPAN